MKHLERKALIEAAEKGEKIGIEQLKKVKTWKAELIIEIAAILKKKKEGKRISRVVVLRFINDFMGLIQIIENHKEIYKELLDLDDYEKIELKNHFNKELDLGDDLSKQEKAIETLDIMLSTLVDGIIDLSNDY